MAPSTKIALPVRREIRDLSADQWNRVVKAMWKMKKTKTNDGRKTFGPNFYSYDTLLRMHMSAALNPLGDQMHFGPQFGPTHRAWLLLFERSLRAVDPAINGLPYWDFRREESGRYPSIFTNAFLGSPVGKGPGYAVTDGQFANWPTARGDDGDVPVKGAMVNPWGYNRHPQSLNSSPHLSRRGGQICGYNLGLGNAAMWPVCAAAGDLLDWTSCVDANLHGATHSSVAGSWPQSPGQAASPLCAQWYVND